MKLIASLALLFLTSCMPSDVISADVTTVRQYARVVIGVIVDEKGVRHDVGNGSAVVIAPGYVITARHVVDSKNMQFDVGVSSLATERTAATVVKLSEDENVDLALLHVPGIQCPCISIVQHPLEVDQPLIHVGYPMYGIQQIQYLTQGAIQGITNKGLFASTPIAPGSSGGGMFVKESGGYRLAGIAKSVINKPSMGPFSEGQIITWMTLSEPPSKIRYFLMGTPVERN